MNLAILLMDIEVFIFKNLILITCTEYLDAYGIIFFVIF